MDPIPSLTHLLVLTSVQSSALVERDAVVATSNRKWSATGGGEGPGHSHPAGTVGRILGDLGLRSAQEWWLNGRPVPPEPEAPLAVAVGISLPVAVASCSRHVGAPRSCARTRPMREVNPGPDARGSAEPSRRPRKSAEPKVRASACGRSSTVRMFSVRRCSAVCRDLLTHLLTPRLRARSTND